MQVMQQVLQDLLMEEVVELVGQVEMLVLLQLVELVELVFQLQLQDHHFLILVVVGHMVQVQMVQAALVELGVVHLYL